MSLAKICGHLGPGHESTRRQEMKVLDVYRIDSRRSTKLTQTSGADLGLILTDFLNETREQASRGAPGIFFYF